MKSPSVPASSGMVRFDDTSHSSTVRNKKATVSSSSGSAPASTFTFCVASRNG